MRCASLLALVFLTGCATLPWEVTKVHPPAALLEPCPAPEWRVATNGELARTLLDYRQALRLCNNDKEALRLWVTQ